MKKNAVYLGDCIDVMRQMDADSVDSIITDPPYSIKFMGKKWDVHKNYQEWTRRWAVEALRVLKPGGTMLCFGSPRTYHREACGIEDAGFIIKDCIMWVYGQGFPHGLNIGKHLDNWQGWASHSLKPSYEPILCCIKPNDGTYVDNALKHGVSGLNIEGARIPTKGEEITINTWDKGAQPFGGGAGKPYTTRKETKGRYPANLILDEKAGQLLDEQSGINASRFFFCAKANRKERELGCEHLEEKLGGGMSGTKDQSLLTGSGNIRNNKRRNHHPTVKPLKLMEYLCTLTKTPTGGIVLDPFAGSGTTGLACQNTGRDFILIELERQWCEIAMARLGLKEFEK
jgi:site-specific DNA-methyltransferase (adenine-specific)